MPIEIDVQFSLTLITAESMNKNADSSTLCKQVKALTIRESLSVVISTEHQEPFLLFSLISSVWFSLK